MEMADQELISKVKAYVESYMNKFDASHDFHHIERVVGTAHRIATRIAASTFRDSIQGPIPLDITVVTLGALLHDVGDRKYLEPGQDQKILVRDLLLSFGAPSELAMKIQTICLAVSWNEEMKDPGYVRDLIDQYPELAVVQDADRLDAIGAVGIGRVFTYGGARTTRGLEDSIGMIDGKLMSLEAMMKTDPGRTMARRATQRLRIFRGWWDEEIENEDLGRAVLAAANDVASPSETNGA